MKRFARMVGAGTAISASAMAMGQTQPAPGPAERFSLTIYSTADPASFDPQTYAQQQRQQGYPQIQLPGYGVVREVRGIDLQQGISDIRFTDVAAGIDPTTVSFKSLTAPDAVAVLEQNYEYDLVNPNKLLEKYLDQKIILIRKTQGGLDAVPGTLLSYDGGTIVLKTDTGIEIIPRNEDISSINLAELSAGLITKPTLVWKVESGQAGQHDAQVTYQTDGLTWRADYNVVLNANDTAADIGAWVSIMNMSGLSYPEAQLKLVAGDVQRLEPPQPENRVRFRDMAGAVAAEAAGFQEKAFFEYHLYTLGRATTLPNNSTKQIELFPQRADVPVNKTFVYYGLPEQYRLWNYGGGAHRDRDLGIEMNKKVDVYVLLDNNEKNGMGMPLPAGRIRVYKQDDADGAMEFIGEDIIQHTPKDEEVMIKLGSAFDIVGERRQMDFTVDERAHVITESFEIKLRNHKKEPVTVIIKENLFRWANWEIAASSDKWEKQDMRTIHIPVEVPVDGEKVVTYTVKYTW